MYIFIYSIQSFFFTGINISTLDQKPKIRYELLTGAQPTPEIILTRPILEQNATVTNAHGQPVALMSSLGHSHPQLVATQIPTKQYISPQPQAIPILLSEPGSETNIASYPIRVMPTSGGPGDLIKLEVNGSSAYSPTSNAVITQPSYTTDNIYPNFTVNGGNTRVCDNGITEGVPIRTSACLTNNKAPHLQYVTAGLDIEKLKGLRLTDTTAATMDFQSVSLVPSTERPTQLQDPMSIGQLEEVRMGNLNQALTKMAVNYSNTMTKSPFAPNDTTGQTLPAVAERNSEEYITLPTITSMDPVVSYASHIPIAHHVPASEASNLNVQLICHDKVAPNYNESVKV